MFLDHASDAHLRYWRINVEVHRTGLALVRPGTRCCDIAHQLNEIYARHGVLAQRSFDPDHNIIHR